MSNAAVILGTDWNAAMANTAGQDTPFFIFSRERIRRNVRMFEDCFPQSSIYYAMKANSEPELLRSIYEFGYGFEVASKYELDLLKAIGVPPECIIYGSAIKPRCHIRDFTVYGVDRFAFDSVAELEKIAANAPGARVYARLNVDDTGSVFRFSEKFGMEQSAILPSLSRATSLGLRSYGISFHVGSQSMNPMALAEAVRTVREAAVELGNHGIPVDTINIGGGFPYDHADDGSVPSLEQIACTTMQEVKSLPYDMKLIIEPGRAIVASAAILVTSVIGKIKRNATTWLFLDAGVYNALFEALACQGSTRYRVTSFESMPDISHATFALAGPTGDGLDVICRHALLPENTEVGDRIIIHNVGAYTLSLASTFNGFPKPNVYFI